jgi:hypothetical protein
MLKPVCQHCQSEQHVKLRRRINANGATAVFWYCLTCQRSAELNGRALKHERAAALLAPHGKTIDDLPIVDDYRTNGEPCIICGERETEFNHWLPQTYATLPEIASEWSTWANVGAPLCHRHHLLWHRIVTPQLPGIGSNRIR